MKTLFCSLIVTALLASGCSGVKVHSPDASVVYHNAQYGLTFSLPDSWRGYSVLTQEWTGTAYSAAKDGIVEAEHGPMIVLRNPQWKAEDPYQDIPIMVFTRRQWEDDKQGKFSIGAGGMEYEVAHNAQYVFGVHSRFNWGEARGWQEADKIVQRNCAANAPHLYEE